MDVQMRLYWEAYSELFSTTDIIRTLYNPLRDYESEFVEGAIVDIGCGQTSYLLEYMGSGRTLIGIDNEQYQLDQLAARFKEEGQAITHILKLENVSLLKNELPKGNYSVVFMANILHFFTLEECGQIINQLEENLMLGSFVQISVHSDKYYANDPSNPNNNEYFKHYFSRSDLDTLFTSEKYDRILFTETERCQTEKEREVTLVWIGKYMDHLNIHNPSSRASILEEQSISHLENDLICVYRRK